MRMAWKKSEASPMWIVALVRVHCSVWTHLVEVQTQIRYAPQCQTLLQDEYSVRRYNHRLKMKSKWRELAHGKYRIHLLTHIPGLTFHRLFFSFLTPSNQKQCTDTLSLPTVFVTNGRNCGLAHMSSLRS